MQQTAKVILSAVTDKYMTRGVQMQDDIPEEALTAEKEEIKSALEQMDRELRPPPGREFEPYENMDQAG